MVHFCDLPAGMPGRVNAHGDGELEGGGRISKRGRTDIRSGVENGSARQQSGRFRRRYGGPMRKSLR